VRRAQGWACALALLFATGVHADEAPPTELETVTVATSRTPQRVQDAPASVTVIGPATIDSAGVISVQDATRFAPELRFNDFSARAISNAQIRGVGGSTTNPAVTTYVDGVPQLSADTSSSEFLDIGQVEIVRGPQGTLYGRNTLGGLIAITSARPAAVPFAGLEVGGGNFGERDARLKLSGPLVDGLRGTIAGGYRARDGFSVNDVTGQDLDSRRARFGKAQLSWQPSEAWDVRLIAGGENARDGDFALYDLASLRERPYHVEHDFTGFTRRNLLNQTLAVAYLGDAFEVASSGGHVSYTAHEKTDLDASSDPDFVRDNQRRGEQWTGELSLRSPREAPVRIGADVSLRWQVGALYFRQSNDQDAVNDLNQSTLFDRADIFLPLPGLPVSLPIGSIIRSLPGDSLPIIGHAEQRADAALDDDGIGGYLQTTLTWADLDLTLGARYDVEHKRALLANEFVLLGDPGELPLFGPTIVNDARRYSDVSPSGSIGYHPMHDLLLYVAVARGYRAGGFNPNPPAGKASYAEEHSTSYELGVKGQWLDRRLTMSAALFRIDLDDLQLNVPVENSPGRFYIDNAGQARNQGFELLLAGRPIETLQVYATLGTLSAHFREGSEDMGNDISGNRLPFADPLTLAVGADYAIQLGSATLTLRPEYQHRGDYFYTAQNTERQPGYALWGLRAAMRWRRFSAALFGQNLGDTDTIPVAIPFTGVAPSGYVGENAAARTVGAEISVEFAGGE